jgi:signal transduction histidine kinase
MSLQKRLTWLLIAFAAFALLAAFVTIYAAGVHVESAIAGLQRRQSEMEWIERLRVRAREQQLLIQEIVVAARPADERYFALRDAFLNELHQVARYTLQHDESRDAERILSLVAALRDELDAVLAATQAGRLSDARTRLRTRLAEELFPAVDNRLQTVRGMLAASESSAVDALVASNVQLLGLALAVAAAGGGLVVLGIVLIRRWILVPIRVLEASATEYGRGNLAHRTERMRRDELGALGTAMNEMADGLAAAQAELRASEAKYRGLFENLRDATLLCDATSRVIECQDGETGLLSRFARDCTGRKLAELCPATSSFDWMRLIAQVLQQRQRVRATDVRLPGGAAQAGVVVDLIAFPLSVGGAEACAIVLRDVTEQRQVERQVRRTEAMEATVTLARGAAHDFSSLLSSAIGSLSLLSAEITNGRHGELIRRALRVCGQAVSLSRTLLTFAGGDRGRPEILNLRETVELILGSLDEACLARVTVSTELDARVTALIDRDQFTEIVLNLVRNACEAMPTGGELIVRLEAASPALPPQALSPPTHARLTVADSGPGIPPEVRERLFEPFYSTKGGGTRSRGMGLAMVHAAVKNAGGTVAVHSTPGAGSVFEVWLPLSDAPSDEASAAPGTAVGYPGGESEKT